jgi:hypothetical protein
LLHRDGRDSSETEGMEVESSQFVCMLERSLHWLCYTGCHISEDFNINIVRRQVFHSELRIIINEKLLDNHCQISCLVSGLPHSGR